jgi:hypothetical protein
VTRRELPATTLTAALLAVLLTWPMGAQFGASGRIHSGDGRYSIWNVAWVAHALTTDPHALFDANIFYPHQGTLAYSSANIVAGAIAAPVWWITGNPYAASNFVTMMSFVLAALAAFALVRRLTGSRAAAAFGGIAFAFCPFVFSHLPHVQLLMTFALPLVLLALHRFVASPSWRTAAWLGLSMALQALACEYYGVFGGLAAGLGAVWFAAATGRLRDRRYWALALGAAALAVALVLPFFLPYLQIQAEGFSRTLDEARVYSAGWRAYLASDGVLHRWMLPWLGTWGEVLFPGFLPVGFAAATIVWQARAGRHDALPAPAAVVGFYVTLGLLAAWASAGPDAGLYTALHAGFPLFSMLRAPARFGILVTLSVAVLGAIGVAALERRLAPPRRTAVLLVILAASIAGSSVGPLELDAAPALPPAVARLATLPRAPVVEFPYFSAPADRSRHTEYMLLSTFHWQPLVNGYSDHMPADAARDMLALATFPGTEAWRVLRRLEVRYVLVHWRSYSRVQLEALVPLIEEQASRLRLMAGGPEVSLYEIVR